MLLWAIHPSDKICRIAAIIGSTRGIGAIVTLVPWMATEQCSVSSLSSSSPAGAQSRRGKLLRCLSILQASSRCQRLKQVGIFNSIHIYHHLQTAMSQVVNCALIMALWKVFPRRMLCCTKDIKPLLKGGRWSHLWGLIQISFW